MGLLRLFPATGCLFAKDRRYPGATAKLRGKVTETRTHRAALRCFFNFRSDFGEAALEVLNAIRLHEAFMDGRVRFIVLRSR